MTLLHGGRIVATWRLALSALGTLACLATSSSAAQSYTRINKLFDGGTGGYHSYRIPSIVCAGNNVLIAFCEGRVSSDDDFGNINLVYKRSTNNGASWSGLMEIEGVGPGT